MFKPIGNGYGYGNGNGNGYGDGNGNGDGNGDGYGNGNGDGNGYGNGDGTVSPNRLRRDDCTWSTNELVRHVAAALKEKNT